MEERGFRQRDMSTMEQLPPHVSPIAGPSFRTVFLTMFVVKTGRWGGVVTAFISMSDIKDEIDWEFPGNTTTQAQSNYFWQGDIRKSEFLMPSHHITFIFSSGH